MYPYFVFCLPQDGHMIGRNMQEIIPYMAIVIHLFEFVSIIIVYNQLIDYFYVEDIPLW